MLGTWLAKAYKAFWQGAFGDWSRIIEGFSKWRTQKDSTRDLPHYGDLAQCHTVHLRGFGGSGRFPGGACSISVQKVNTSSRVWLLSMWAMRWSACPGIFTYPWLCWLGIVGGALWAAIPGYLKGKTGAHEVINTIMMNYIAYRFAEFMLDVGGPMSRGDGRPVSPEIQTTAYLPQFFPNSASLRVNVGIILALLTAGLIWWMLYKTTLGYEIRTVGENPRAAKYAGMNVPRTILITMMISGGLAGLSGATDIFGRATLHAELVQLWLWF